MKPIFINSNPNVESDDFNKALFELLNPVYWNQLSKVEKFESKVESYFNLNAVAFDSARTSFFHILKSLDIKEGDEVIVPAFTCVVIVNPIIWLKAKPVYVDIDPITLNINYNDFKSKITDKTKAVLIQHTFGLPVDFDKVQEILGNKEIAVIEDCAHSLGIKYKDKLTGTLGDAAVITFGMTKVISGVRGGMAISNDEGLITKLKIFRNSLPSFPFKQNLKFIFNPVIWHFITPVYYLGFGKLTLGKIIIGILHKIGILGINNIVEPVEEKAKMPSWMPRRMSGALANMASHQFDKLEKFISHRKKIAKIYAEYLELPYFEESGYLRFAVMVKDRKEVLNHFRKNRIMLGDWYKSILHIPKENYGLLQYENGSCKVAEKVTENLINLPTNIKVNEKDAIHIVKMIENFIDYDYYKSN